MSASARIRTHVRISPHLKACLHAHQPETW